MMRDKCSFRGELLYLSNMYVLTNPIETEYGILVPTSEHAYQANRFADEDMHTKVATAEDGLVAKDLAHELLEAGVSQKPDWDFIKVGAMYGILTQKFLRNPDIAAKLVRTGNMDLVEGNTWGDRFWGVCPPNTHDGQNHLGKVLMRVRFDLKAAKDVAA